MRILAVDTAAEACSVALGLGGDAVIERYSAVGREHAQRVLTLVEAVLQEAGLALDALDGLAFGCGPGSFTGIRIAAAAVQGLAFGADLPVAPVSNLAMLAQGALRVHGQGRVLACIDARMGEVYWGLYARDAEGVMVAEAAPRIGGPESLSLGTAAPVFAAGSGWKRYPALLERLAPQLSGCDGNAVPAARDALPSAARALAAGRGVSAERALPEYLREEVTRR